jgi:hypothetical protein
MANKKADGVGGRRNFGLIGGRATPSSGSRPNTLVLAICPDVWQHSGIRIQDPCVGAEDRLVLQVQLARVGSREPSDHSGWGFDTKAAADAECMPYAEELQKLDLAKAGTSKTCLCRSAGHVRVSEIWVPVRCDPPKIIAHLPILVEHISCRQHPRDCNYEGKADHEAEADQTGDRQSVKQIHTSVSPVLSYLAAYGT